MIRYKAVAIRQLRDIGAYIARDNPAAAARVVSAIHAAIERLRDFPKSYRTVGKGGARELVISGLPYIVVYRVRGDCIDILGVFHAARDPSARNRP